jgi:hypothetical protein
VRYAVRTSACEECPLKSKCTNSPKGRWVSRSLEEEYLDRVRAYRETEAYRKALLKRAVWVEPLLGEANEWHVSRRFRLRGLEKENAEALMIASGQNVKRLVSFGPRGPKKTAMVAALRPPEKPSPHLLRRHRTIPAWRFSTAWIILRSPHATLWKLCGPGVGFLASQISALELRHHMLQRRINMRRLVRPTCEMHLGRTEASKPMSRVSLLPSADAAR